VEFVLPSVAGRESWVPEIDTGDPGPATSPQGGAAIAAGGRMVLSDFSLMVLRCDGAPAPSLD